MVGAGDLDLFPEVHKPISPMCGILATDMSRAKSPIGDRMELSVRTTYGRER